MEITFNAVKNEVNIRERNLSFEAVNEFGFHDADYFVDDRKEYGETRWIAIGYYRKRLHVLCYVETEKGIRVISFRKANSKEARKYEKPKTIDG